MIDTIVVELGGKEYELTLDPDASPSRCWHWSEVRTYLAPGTAVAAQLNRLFIEQHAALLVQQMEPFELVQFSAILQAMGASARDLEQPGLEVILAITAPQRFRERRFEKLPPAGHNPFNCPAIRDWAFAPQQANWAFPTLMTCLGAGPFAQDEFIAFLRGRNIMGISFESFPEEDGTTLPPAGEVILGRHAWDEETVDDVIDQHEGRYLRIYSQEMFVQALLCRRDPFAAPQDVLAAFRAGHAGLEFVSQGWSGWVNTFVPSNRRSSGTSPTNTEGWQAESPLKAMGYQVGRHGISAFRRHEILTRAFERELPIVGEPQYMAEWGEPGSADRLRKIANHIAFLCRNQRAKPNWSEEAIEDWEADLEWLRETVYHGHFAFHWPDTFV